MGAWESLSELGTHLLAALGGGAVACKAIDSQKASLLKSRLAEKMWKEFFQAAPIGMALVGEDGKFIQTNRAFSRMIGYVNNQLEGRHFSEISVDDKALKKDKELVQELIEGRRSAYHLDKSYVHSNGRHVPVTIHVSKYDLDIPVFLVAVIDRTEQEAIRKQVSLLSSRIRRLEKERREVQKAASWSAPFLTQFKVRSPSEEELGDDDGTGDTGASSAA